METIQNQDLVEPFPLYNIDFFLFRLNNNRFRWRVKLVAKVEAINILNIIFTVLRMFNRVIFCCLFTSAVVNS